ncbi:MAG: hypothetical protein OCC49_16390 [Fibrobacterales bacterium]
MAQYTVKADTTKNILYLSMDGFFEHSGIQEISDAIVRELSKLEPGYGFINDVSQFKPTTEEGVEEIKQLQLRMYNNGLGKVVRVVGESLMSKLQFERKSKEVGYSADHVQSISEAEEIIKAHMQQEQ